jgi:hypothetical protein
VGPELLWTQATNRKIAVPVENRNAANSRVETAARSVGEPYSVLAQTKYFEIRVNVKSAIESEDEIYGGKTLR